MALSNMERIEAMKRQLTHQYPLDGYRVKAGDTIMFMGRRSILTGDVKSYEVPLYVRVVLLEKSIMPTKRIS
jgi:hypothetical protein